MIASKPEPLTDEGVRTLVAKFDAVNRAELRRYPRARWGIVWEALWVSHLRWAAHIMGCVYGKAAAQKYMRDYADWYYLPEGKRRASTQPQRPQLLPNFSPPEKKHPPRLRLVKSTQDEPPPSA